MMADTKWTPGEWSYSWGDDGAEYSHRYSTISVDGGDIVIAEVNDRIPEGRANGHLLAASRAMYETLARIASMSPGGPHISAKDGMGAALATIDRMRDIANAELARARGEREPT